MDGRNARTGGGDQQLGGILRRDGQVRGAWARVQLCNGLRVVAEKKELAGVIAEPYSSADFLHCPIAMVKVDFPIFTAVPDGKAYPPLFELLRTPYTERQVGIFSVTDREEVIRLSRASVRLPVRIPERLTPMVSVVPAQLFSYHLTRHKGLDPDHPVGLTKVTKTC